MVLAVGCGGGGDSTTEVTKAEFTQQANSICAEGKKTRKAAYENYAKEVQAKANGTENSKLEQELAEEMIHKTVVPSLQDQLAELEELEVPAADQGEISKMLNTLSKGTGDLEKGGVRKLVSGGKLVSFQEQAEGYGLSCAVF